MASSLVHSHKTMKRTESRKSHSWWWDSHIGPKNSRWLADNLDEMDKSVKHMLKLIEEDGDSFAKKAEMYYQKRPELVAHVEEFYRMYRSLAERYDHLTGELQKSVPSDLQSQGSGISDVGSEPASFWPSPDQKISRSKSGPRAAGFDFFLGSGGNSSDVYQKEGDEPSSSSDSESESDNSSVNNYSILTNSDGQGLQRKITESDMKEKLQIQQEDCVDGSTIRREHKHNVEDLLAKIAGYEQELRNANEKVQLSKEEIVRLKIELQKYESSGCTNGFAADEDVNMSESKLELSLEQGSGLQESIASLESHASDPNNRVHMLEEELRIAKEMLHDSEKEIASLRHEVESNRSSSARVEQLQSQLEVAEKSNAMTKSKLNAERREVSKLQERIARLKTSLSDRDHEVRDLKIAVSDAEQKIFPEKSQIKAEICKLMEERKSLEEQLREWESRGRASEEEIRNVKSEKLELEERLKGEIYQLTVDVAERSEEIEELRKSLEVLIAERDGLYVKMVNLETEMRRKNDRNEEMEKHLHQLHVEHVNLIAGMERTGVVMEELRTRVKELEQEVEKQGVMILEGAEEKREAIRQLCFSLEHYMNGYHMLRRAFVGHKRGAEVLAI